MKSLLCFFALLFALCSVQTSNANNAHAHRTAASVIVKLPNYDSLITLAAHKFCGDIMNKKRSGEANTDVLALIGRIDAQLKKTPGDSALQQMSINAHGLHLLICAFGLQLDSTLTLAQFADASLRMNEVVIKDATPVGSCVQITRLWINMRTWYFFRNNSDTAVRIDYDYESSSGRTTGFGSEFLFPHSVAVVYDNWVELGLMGEDWLTDSNAECK